MILLWFCVMSNNFWAVALKIRVGFANVRGMSK